MLAGFLPKNSIMTKRNGFIGRLLVFLTAWSLVLPAFALPYSYYVLRPSATEAISVMSLEPSNTVSTGSTQLTLSKYGLGSISAGELASGTIVAGTGFFVPDAVSSGSRIIVPQELLGESFVVPHFEGSHKYLLLSPNTPASVEITVGGNTSTITLSPGVVTEFDAGATNGASGVISASGSILVAHLATVGNVERHVYPVPPVSQDLFGVRSQQVIVAAQSDGTVVSVYSSSGASTSHTLDAGAQLAINVGSNGVQGAGDAVHLSANQPIAAVQYDDGDGLGATALWPEALFATAHGFAAGTQYAVAVCVDSNVSVTLYRGAAVPETQLCSGSLTSPGKVYFGASVSGANMGAGWHLISSGPVYVMAERASTELEASIKGFNPPEIAPPLLDSPPANTSSNPLSLTGTAAANQAVRVYVNGIAQDLVTADANGAFSIPAALFDGGNTVYVVAVVGNDESPPSNTAQVNYSNTTPRSQSGTITGTVVWTPGQPAQPYTVTAADLTVASGAKLILQPGTQVQFGSGRKIVVNGSLVAQGTATSKIRFTTTSTTPAKGAWTGIVINSGADEIISDAIVEYATQGVTFTGPTTGTPQPLGGILQNSELRNNTTAIYLSGYVNPTIRNNVIQQNTNGVYLDANSTTLAASPSITYNRIASNSAYGVVLRSRVAGQKLPQWTLANNGIYSNTTYNFYLAVYSSSTNFDNPATTRVVARNNWWGSTSPSTVSAKIYDYTDSVAFPSLDYGGYLSAENGSPVPGDMFIGTMEASTTFSSDTVTRILGDLIVPAGVTLTIPAGGAANVYGDIRILSGGALSMAPGTRMTIVGNYGVQVEGGGTLTLQGSAENKVVFTSGWATKAKGDWTSITVNAGATATISHALIEFAMEGVTFTGATSGAAQPLGGLVEYSEFRTNTTAIYLLGYVNPTIRNNLIQQNTTGVQFDANSTTLVASPSITYNQIINNSTYGVVLKAYVANQKLPQWTLENNSLYGSGSYNFFLTTRSGSTPFVNPATTKVAAKGNWWGNTSPSTISSAIYDYTDVSALPSLDYGGYLSTEGGAPVSGDMLLGTLAENTTLAGSGVTRILGDLVVPSGVSLTIPAGASVNVYGDIAVASGGALSMAAGSKLSVVGNYGIQVSSGGTLALQGDSNNKVWLTSGRSTKAKGNWSGVTIYAGAMAAISGALIEYAAEGVSFVGLTTGTPQPLGGLLEESELRNNTTGVYLSGYVNPAVNNNLIHQNTNGIYFDANSATLTASPSITYNQIINNSSYGVVLRAYVASQKLPQWTLVNNGIYGNTSYNFYLLKYSSSTAFANPATTKVDAKNNWWGSADPAAITLKMYDYSDEATLPSLDYGNYLASEGGSPVPGEMLLGTLAGNKTIASNEAVLIIGNLVIPAGVTMDVAMGGEINSVGNIIVQSGGALTAAGGTLRFSSSGVVVQGGGALSLIGSNEHKVYISSGKDIKAKSDWNGISIGNGGIATIAHAVIEYAKEGVLFLGPVSGSVQPLGGLVEHSEFRFNQSGVYLRGYVNPAISNNLFEGNTNGIWLDLNSTVFSPSPSISQNKVVRNDSYGVAVRAIIDNPILPAWSFSDNEIYENTLYDLYLSNSQGAFSNPSTSKVLARGNWWGTVNASSIAAKVRDFTDLSALPSLDYGGYLSQENGPPVPGEMLIGTLTDDVTLGAGISRILGNVIIPSGISVTMPAGTLTDAHGHIRVESGGELVLTGDASLRFIGVYGVQVLNGGVLNIEGGSGQKVLLTSGRPSKAKGDWAGVVVSEGATATIIGALIEYATDGVTFTGPTAGAPPPLGGRLEQSELANNDTAVRLQGYVNPVVKSNLIQENTNGVWLDANSTTLAASPEITHNRIVVNSDYGVVIRASVAGQKMPAWTLASNSIFGNAKYNFYFAYSSAFASPSSTRVAAMNNWWGHNDPVAISETIYDYLDVTSRPLLDFGSYLLAENGDPVTGASLIGRLSAELGTVLQEGRTYQILGPIWIPAGQNLTIPRGVTLRFMPGSWLTVSGSLVVDGDPGQEVVMTSMNVVPATGDWSGINVNSTATSFEAEHLVVQYANNGVYFNGSGPVGIVRDSLIHRCANAGVYVNGNASPLITGSRLVVNKYGLFVNGTASDLTDPKPRVVQSDIYSNTTAFSYQTMSANPTVKMDLTNNWWGTLMPTFNGNVFEYLPVASAPLKAPAAKSHATTNLYFSPNSDAVQDDALISATLSEQSDWQLEVRGADNNQVLKSYSGTGTAVSAGWDGKGPVGEELPDGHYVLVLRTAAGSRAGLALYREFVLDNTLPEAAIDPIISIAPHRNVLSVPVAGTTKDSHFLNYSVDYGSGTVPSSWSPLATNIATAVENKQLTNWVVGTTTGSTHVPNGDYTVRLSVRDMAGNVGVATALATIDNLVVAEVTHTSELNVASGQPGQIAFSINLPGTFTVKIYELEAGVQGSPVRTLVFNFDTAGPKSVQWDGRDEAGNIVPGRAYLYVIEGSDGQRQALYNVSNVAAGSVTANFQQVNSTCDPYRNLYYTLTVTAPQAGLAGIQLTTPQGVIYPFGERGKPVKAGTTTLRWDCRNPATGALITGAASQYAAFIPLPKNTILIAGNDYAPTITGAAPVVEVQADPYLVYLSYGQSTKIVYDLRFIGSSEASVQIKLLPPLVLDFDDPSAIPIYEGARAPGIHELTWQGALPGLEGSAMRSIGSAEGAYTFAIKATANGMSTLYRGTLSAYQ